MDPFGVINSLDFLIQHIFSGLIGSCWATLFASAGYSVTMYDISYDQLEKARANVKTNLEKLSNEGLLRGTIPADKAFSAVNVTTSLKDALDEAVYVQVSRASIGSIR